jgi:DNA modification methylase
MSLRDDYVTDEATGEGWRLTLGDSCEELGKLPAASVDLSVYSPPFASLYTYSPSARDLGNSASEAQFFEHYSFVIRELLRVTKPGRVSCVHVTDIPIRKSTHGYMGLYDFPGDVLRAHQRAGWIYYGRVTVDKNPQAQAIRTKSHALMFVTKNRDSSASRPAIADYLLVFKKPGDNQVPVKTDVTNDEWIEWARPAWPAKTDAEVDAEFDELGLTGDERLGWGDMARGGLRRDLLPEQLVHDASQMIPGPVWYGIRETNTLNERVGREDADERHICPLQLEFIARCVRLWSNPGDTVLSPFAGIGSEVYMAVKLGRRGVGVELKASYWKTFVDNLRRLDADVAVPALFGAEGGMP